MYAPFGENPDKRSNTNGIAILYPFKDKFKYIFGTVIFSLFSKKAYFKKNNMLNVNIIYYLLFEFLHGQFLSRIPDPGIGF